MLTSIHNAYMTANMVCTVVVLHLARCVCMEALFKSRIKLNNKVSPYDTIYIAVVASDISTGCYYERMKHHPGFSMTLSFGPIQQNKADRNRLVFSTALTWSIADNQQLSTSRYFGLQIALMD